jgi:hypothetical protein
MTRDFLDLRARMRGANVWRAIRFGIACASCINNNGSPAVFARHPPCFAKLKGSRGRVVALPVRYFEPGVTSPIELKQWSDAAYPVASRRWLGSWLRWLGSVSLARSGMWRSISSSNTGDALTAPPAHRRRFGLASRGKTGQTVGNASFRYSTASRELQTRIVTALRGCERLSLATASSTSASISISMVAATRDATLY